MVGSSRGEDVGGRGWRPGMWDLMESSKTRWTWYRGMSGKARWCRATRHMVMMWVEKVLNVFS